MDNYYFISFDSTNYALHAEKILKDYGYNIVIIPTPREVTQSCGLSIKFSDVTALTINENLEKENIKIKGIYYLKKENGIKILEKIV
jgi:hypothetical protein